MKKETTLMSNEPIVSGQTAALPARPAEPAQKATSPGSVVRKHMAYLGMSQKELAARLEINERHLRKILNGPVSLTIDMALRLQYVLGPDAEYWMALETSFQLERKRIEAERAAAAEIKVLDSLPYRQMATFQWVDDENDRSRQIEQCRVFFGVSDLRAIQPSYEVLLESQRLGQPAPSLAVLAWLRQAEIESQPISTMPFSQKRLRALIPEFRELTLQDPSVFFPRMQALCATAGIALVLARYLPGTYVTSATVWRGEKAIVALSVRGRRADLFWFTFFRELAHLLQHPGRAHFHFDNQELSEKADEMAGRFLIPEKQYEQFVREHHEPDAESIIAFARQAGVSPSIVVGRLQHEKRIEYSQFSELRPSYKIADDFRRRGNFMMPRLA